MNHWNFSGKVVYCNCDNPSFSNFYKYFKDNFTKHNLKLLIATYYDKEPKKFVYNGNEEKSELIKSGRFQDNIDTLKQCDCVVTNPPYSDNMPIELFELCEKYHKFLLFVGPLHFGYHPKTFKWFQEGKLNAGCSYINQFSRPEGGEKGVASAWWTNDAKHALEHHPELHTGKKYDHKNMRMFDNQYEGHDVLNIPKEADIPDDYNDLIGTSIRFITHINRNQFDVIGYKKMKLNGKLTMTKLIIKRKNS